MISIFETKNEVAQNTFYDIEWAVKVYGLRYGIQDTIEHFFVDGQWQLR